MALLYCRSPVFAPRPLMVTSATRPGITVSAGMSNLGKAAMMGVRRAALMLRADSARCTSASASPPSIPGIASAGDVVKQYRYMAR
jgi:hypothetical protein